VGSIENDSTHFLLQDCAATQASGALVNQTTTSFITGGMGWNGLENLANPFHREKTTLDDYRRAILENTPDIATTVLSALWAQERFPMFARLYLVVDILEHTKSIRVLSDACQIVGTEAQIGLDILNWPRYPEWWKTHKDRHAVTLKIGA